jgi:aryl-alcohol dehydrogenase-like predicted oxidoreductase
VEYRPLGRSGCVVSALALGTMTFGYQTEEKEAHAQLDRFVEAGGNLIDTADVCSAGAAEEIIGRWLASRRELQRDVVLATKGRFALGKGVNDDDLSRRLVDRSGVSSVILGARTVEQLTENLEAAGLHLTPGATHRLGAASELTPADYPYGGPGCGQRSRSVPEPQLS